MATEQFSDPIDYLVFTFDEHAGFGSGFSAVLERVQQGIVEILDIELISADSDGAPATLSLAQLDGVTGIDLSVFEGAESGILDAEDLAAIASELRSGQIALAIVYEDRSLAAAADAWIAAGGAELFSGGVAIADLERTLDTLDGAAPVSHEGNRS